jgi:hypothetical protein
VAREDVKRQPSRPTREYRLVDENGRSLGVYGAVEPFAIGRIVSLGGAGRWRVAKIEETPDRALYVDGIQWVATLTLPRHLATRSLCSSIWFRRSTR